MAFVPLVDTGRSQRKSLGLFEGLSVDKDYSIGVPKGCRFMEVVVVDRNGPDNPSRYRRYAQSQDPVTQESAYDYSLEAGFAPGAQLYPLQGVRTRQLIEVPPPVAAIPDTNLGKLSPIYRPSLYLDEWRLHLTVYQWCSVEVFSTWYVWYDI